MEGYDKVGALIILNKNPLTGEQKNWCYWSGSILGQESKFFGATTMQVGIGVLTALKWAIENPTKGPCWSEALPSDWVIEHCSPFLGRIYSGPVDWSPEST